MEFNEYKRSISARAILFRTWPSCECGVPWSESVRFNKESGFASLSPRNQSDPPMHHRHVYKPKTVNKIKTVRLQYDAHGPHNSSREHGVVFVCAKRQIFDWSRESFLRTCCNSRIRAPGAHPRDQLSSNTCQHMQATHQTETMPDSIAGVLAGRQFPNP
jgi:hypothetical protein